MFGFVLGTVCLFGLAGMAAHHHCHGPWRAEPCCGGRSRRRRGWEHEGIARAAGEIFKRRLRIDESQEDLVDHALRDAHASIREAVRALREEHGAVAEAFRGETVDDPALESIFARHDEAVRRARREVVSAMKQIHAVLDADQRKRAADWLARASFPGMEV